MIDFRSDSVTQPTEQMRDAARDAETGHDGYGDDPTVSRLESEVADLVDTDDAMFVPSGTMANLIAVVTHTRTGQEIILEKQSHIYTMEVAGLSRVAGLLPRPVDAGPRGVVTADHVLEELSTGNGRHLFKRSPTGLLALENTHNARGGTAIAPEAIAEAAMAASQHEVPTHLDGARLARAAAANDCAIDEYTRSVDSVYIDLAKIGAPIGSILAGEAGFIERAHRYRQLFGGHMKQVGLVAAPALVALDDLDRIGEDAEKASRLAAGLSGIEGFDVHPPETNLVYVDTEGAGFTAGEFIEVCEDAGILATIFGTHLTRLATHRDIEPDDIDEVIDQITTAVTAFDAP